jgi:hypothetical protein
MLIWPIPRPLAAHGPLLRAAARSFASVVPTAGNRVVAGDKLEFISSGAGDTNVVPTTFYADILVN